MTLILKILLLKKWYIINDENNTNYGVNKDTGANNPDTIKYDTRVLKPNLCHYADTYILVDGKIRAIPGAPVGDPAAVPALDLTRLALKNCSPFPKCNLEINDEHVDTAENLDIAMSMYNLIKILLNNKIKDFNEYKTKEQTENANANIFKYIKSTFLSKLLLFKVLIDCLLWRIIE